MNGYGTEDEKQLLGAKFTRETFLGA